MGGFPGRISGLPRTCTGATRRSAESPLHEHRGSGCRIEGDTFEHRELIQEHGGWWDPERKMWQVREAEQPALLQGSPGHRRSEAHRACTGLAARIRLPNRPTRTSALTYISCFLFMLFLQRKLARHWFPPKTPHTEHATPSGQPGELPGPPFLGCLGS